MERWVRPPTTCCFVERLNLLQLKIDKSHVYTNMGLGRKSIVETVGRQTVRTCTMRETFSDAEKSLNPSAKVEVTQGMLKVANALPSEVLVKLKFIMKVFKDLLSSCKDPQ